ncbi:unnamed protein product [Schistosoma curassoni]|uniref:Endo/exonuclease/phosphatase domain-containing protein n=1 Tax=Schistosoma curassoni TaxID=6186 RepID=A0A183KZU7_9TREM|nr:unnamed protein product [Schistosoma curassoni]
MHPPMIATTTLKISSTSGYSQSLRNAQRKDPTILVGDLNAKVGIDNTGYEDIMGQHGLDERNESGERFANL